MGHPTVNGRQSGFTYIALLIGVAILGTLLASVGTIWHTLIQRENERDLLYVGNQFRMAFSNYFLSNQRFPTRLEDLVQDDTKVAVKRHIRKIYVDPMTGKTDWGMVKLPGGQIVGIYSLSEEEPLKTAGFKKLDINFKDKKKYSEWVFMAEGQTAVQSTVPNNQQPFSQSTFKFK